MIEPSSQFRDDSVNYTVIDMNLIQTTALLSTNRSTRDALIKQQDLRQSLLRNIDAGADWLLLILLPVLLQVWPEGSSDPHNEKTN